MRYLMLLLLTSCAAAPSAPKQVAIAPDAQCEHPWSEMLPHLKTGVDVVDLTPAQVEHFVAGVNKEPPETNYAADEVHIVSKQGVPMAFAYYVNGGCVSHEIQVPTAVLPALINGSRTSL